MMRIINIITEHFPDSFQIVVNTVQQEILVGGMFGKFGESAVFRQTKICQIVCPIQIYINC